MALVGMLGKHVNQLLLKKAVELRPSFIIDCANCANPHNLFPISEEELSQVFVIEVEVLYMLRDALKNIPETAKKLGVNIIIVTSFHRLFDYGDEKENKDVYEHSWELMNQYSTKYDIIVGIKKDSVHEELARKYCSNIVEV